MKVKILLEIMKAYQFFLVDYILGILIEDADSKNHKREFNFVGAFKNSEACRHFSII